MTPIVFKGFEEYQKYPSYSMDSYQPMFATSDFTKTSQLPFIVGLLNDRFPNQIFVLHFGVRRRPLGINRPVFGLIALSLSASQTRHLNGYLIGHE